VNNNDILHHSVKTSDLPYQTTEHSEISNIGESYLKEINRGIKSFAITSTGYLTSQQKSILAIASYLNQTNNYKVAIVSPNLTGSYFHDMIMNGTKDRLQVQGGHPINYIHFFDHFYFFATDDIMSQEERATTALIEQYDVVMWDFPLFSTVKQNGHHYRPLLQSIESLSIVGNEANNSKEIYREVKAFFNNHDINIKGFTIGATQEKSKGIPWWRKIIK